MPDSLVLHDAERVEKSDLEFLSTVGLTHARQLATAFLTPPGRSFVLSGFTITNPSAKLCRVSLGKAILGAKELGQTVMGTLVSEGDATKTVDLAAYPAGVYRVFIRFEALEGDTANRLFWNAQDSVEYAGNVTTRKKPRWGISVAAVSPGTDWHELGRVTVNASPPLVIVKDRDFYFEGPEESGYIPDWGSGNTRNDDRATFGISDLRTWVQAVNQKMTEIQSGTDPWWKVTTEPLDKKVSRNGDLTLDGNYKFLGSGHSVTVEGTLNVDTMLYANQGIKTHAGGNIGEDTTEGRFGTLYATGARFTGSVAASGGIVPDGAAVDVGGVSDPFRAIYGKRAVHDLASSADGVNVALYGTHSAGAEGVAGIQFGRNAADTVKRANVLYDSLGVLLFGSRPGLGVILPQNGDRFLVNTKVGTDYWTLDYGQGALRVQGDVRPIVDSTSDITGGFVGDGSNRWQAMHARHLVAHVDVIPHADGGADVGSTAAAFLHLYGKTAHASTALEVGPFGSPTTWIKGSAGDGKLAQFGAGSAPFTGYAYGFNGKVDVASTVRAYQMLVEGELSSAMRAVVIAGMDDAANNALGGPFLRGQLNHPAAVLNLPADTAVNANGAFFTFDGGFTDAPGSGAYGSDPHKPIRWTDDENGSAYIKVLVRGSTGVFRPRWIRCFKAEDVWTG